MPYIEKTLRDEIDPEIRALQAKVTKLCDERKIEPDGVMNYAITKLILAFFTGKYAKFARGVGCLECVKQEFYRRAVAPYEDEKRSDPRSGDVY